MALILPQVMISAWLYLLLKTSVAARDKFFGRGAYETPFPRALLMIQRVKNEL